MSPQPSNPYAQEEAPRLRNSVFAFLDILGYAEMIQNAQQEGSDEALLRKLHTALTKGRSWLEDDEQLADLPADAWPKNYALKAFTDNIVIGWPIRSNAESELGSAFFRLAGFQFNMVLEGFFVRGAISVAPAYIDEIAVFGAALIQAYKGEAQLARDPRVILTASAVDTVRTHLAYYHPPETAPHVSALLKDSDGQWFLNYLDTVLVAEYEQGPFYTEFNQHKAAVETKLTEYKNNPTIFSKYAWVAGYHNFFCDLHPQHFSDKHKIKTELFRGPPTRIVD